MDRIEARKQYNEIIERLNFDLDNLDFALSIAGSRDPHQSKLLDCILHNKNIERKKVPLLIKDCLTTFIKLLLHRYILLIGSNKNNQISQQEVILIDTFILPSSIKADKFYDRYFPNYQKYLPSELKRKCFFIPTFVGTPTLKNIIEFKRLQINYICKEKLLRLPDYLFAFSHFLRIKKQISKIKEKNWIPSNIKRSIVNETINNYFNFSTITALLNYRFAKRLGSSNIKPILLIDWYENQVLDKGLNKGFSEFLPKVKRKGYLGFIVDPIFNLHLAPNKYELENNYTPHEIIVTGTGLISRIKEYSDIIQVSSGPALRFSHLHRENNLKSKKSNQILIGLPISEEESKFIVDMIVSTAKELSQYSFIIKQHPSSKIEYKINLTNVSVSDKMTDELLETSQILVSSTSSLCLEAVAKGVPVIILSSPNKYTQKPIPLEVDNRVWNIVHNCKDLSKEIEKKLKFVKESPKEVTKISNITKDLYFEKPTNENVYTLFTSLEKDKKPSLTKHK